ncbi:glucan biosynthesis protein [Acidithiobacillus albertensis]|uniref:glucan biosynthesis protein n=1 Tax=Acidithiobacillus albertensis TaxID=119978 RepID=UPI00094B23A0|nr:glucan biosynthesis protein [Acidithiobacillus albertensis]
MFIFVSKNKNPLFSYAVLGLGAIFALSGISTAFADPFSFANVQKSAQKLSRRAWKPRPISAGQYLRRLSPQAYGRILDVHPLWKGQDLPFEVVFYPLGHTFVHPVQMNVIQHGQSFPLPYSARLFATHGVVSQSQLPRKGGYAGFSLLYPLDTPPYHNEFVSFLGASYFRAVGKGAVYGTSARGLGIDTALPSGEIFPYFQEFWLQRPKPGARHMIIYALLNSPVITGAYRFTVIPGESTRIRVRAVLYPRKKIKQLEIAPLSSMYWHGRGRGIRAGDWHPQQHDSSDLIMAARDGQWITRPLNNPLHIQVTRYLLNNPIGFGFFQQDRRFSNYEGLITQYQKRPSVWIHPLNHWGKGQVELVELPTNNRNTDNMVTFWVPAKPLRPGESLRVHYQIRFFRNDKQLPSGGHPVATFLGNDPHMKGAKTLVVDFAGDGLGHLPAQTPMHAHFTVGAGVHILHSSVRFNPLKHQWQVNAQILPARHQPRNISLFLASKGKVLSDTWLYLLPPQKEAA